MYKICKTEESAARQYQLEQGLLWAMLSEPYDRITISSLCTLLDIPRKTFYRYFPKKEDALIALIDHTLAGCNQMVVFAWEGKQEFRFEDQERFFFYWRSQEPFLRALERNGFLPLLLDRSEAIVDRMKASQKRPGEQMDFARDQIDYAIASGLMTMVLRWHRFGYPCSAQEMARASADLLSSPKISISKLFL